MSGFLPALGVWLLVLGFLMALTPWFVTVAWFLGVPALTVLDAVAHDWRARR